MNSLSWLIYLAGVSSYISGLLVLFATITIIVGVICIVYGATIKDECYSTTSDDWQRGNNIQKKTLWMVPLIAGPLFFVSAFLPSRDTVLAIAASEMGEKLLANQRVGITTNKAMDALDHWLDHQTKVETKDAD